MKIVLAMAMLWGINAYSIEINTTDTAQQNQGQPSAEEFNVNKCLDEATTNQAMIACVHTDYRHQDKKLNRVYADLMMKIDAKAAADDEAGMYAEIKRRVVVAQRSWITYRDATCSVEGIDMMGGTGEPLVVGGCLARMTKERLTYLVDLEKQLIYEVLPAREQVN